MTDKQYAIETGTVKLFFLYRLIQKLNIKEMVDAEYSFTTCSHNDLASKIRKEINQPDALDTPFPAYIQKLLDIRSGIK